MLLVDTNVIIDVVDDDPRWFAWSARQMEYQSRVHELVVNPIVYAELSSAFESQQALEDRLADMEIAFRDLTRPALYLGGMAHRHYRRQGGARHTILADFLIGAHAAVLGCGILTRDPRRYRSYFPRVPLVAPQGAAPISS